MLQLYTLTVHVIDKFRQPSRGWSLFKTNISAIISVVKLVLDTKLMQPIFRPSNSLENIDAIVYLKICQRRAFIQLGSDILYERKEK